MIWLRALLFTVLLPGTIAVYLPWALVDELPPPAPVWRALSLPFFAAGLAVYLWCVWDFVTVGGGTPAPIDAPRRLVVRGLYRHTRNPMYVGVLTVLLGWVVRYRSGGMLAYAIVVWLGFQAFVLFYEEPHLARVFGDQYAAYRATVGRWLPRRG
jgi:protein-S-isoprenylcysteine O-methyltransferase Ste14